MIRLVVEDYCQNCPDFEPEARDVSFIRCCERETLCDVVCVNREKCAMLYSHLKQTSE